MMRDDLKFLARHHGPMVLLEFAMLFLVVTDDTLTTRLIFAGSLAAIIIINAGSAFFAGKRYVHEQNIRRHQQEIHELAEEANRRMDALGEELESDQYETLTYLNELLAREQKDSP